MDHRQVGQQQEQGCGGPAGEAVEAWVYSELRVCSRHTSTGGTSGCWGKEQQLARALYRHGSCSWPSCARQA
jgi:hypothetical protein